MCAFLKNHEGNLAHIVLSFRRKAGNRKPDDTEDLMQEARLALWRRVCAAENPEAAEKYFLHVHRALFDCVRGMAAVSIPSKKFSTHIRNVYVIPWEYTDPDALESQFEGEMIGRLDCQRFLATLEAIERNVLLLKMDGYSQKQIADLLTNGSESRISRIMRRIREKYEVYEGKQAHAI